MSYIHSGLKITFKNEVTKETFDLTHPGGIPEFLQRLVAEGQKAGGDASRRSRSAAQQRRENGGRLAVDRSRPTRRSAPTSTASARRRAARTRTASRAGIAKAIRNYMATHEVKVKGLDITAEDIREGIVGILSVFVREPHVPGPDQGEAEQPGDDRHRG